MQPRLSFDRMLLILIAVGVVSILGVGWIFLTADPGKSRIPPTATPSRLRSLRAARLTAARSPSATLTQDESPLTETSPDAYSGSPTETLTPAITLIAESLPTPSATFTPDRIQPLAARTYDDMDPNIAYDGSWTVLKNPGTKNAYRGTLHVSTAIGSEASFRFKGERFRLGYQRGKNFGIVTVIIDDQSHTFHEEAFDLVWLSPQLPAGDHFVRIIHESGQSINLDYVEILY